MSAYTQLDALTVRRLRRGVGIIAIILPFVVTFGNALITGKFELLGSVSGAYHTGMRDVLVGSMCAIGVFLICYRHARLDDWLSTIAGVLAIVVALFPTKPHLNPTERDLAIWRIHVVSAGLMFLVLAAFCFFVFTRTNLGMVRNVSKEDIPGPKKVRNWIYIVCGWGILLSLGLGIGASALLPHDLETQIQPLFWGEAAAIWFFGLAWLVKGDTLVRDNAGEDTLPKLPAKQ